MYLHARRINHLGTKCCSPESSSGINVSWLMFLHPKPRSCLTEHIPCCWWAGVAATSCRERPSQWTTPNLRAPCGLKNQHQRDWNWQTPKDKMSTEGSWPRRARYQRLGDFPPASSALFAELIWHIWRPRAWFASMRALSPPSSLFRSVHTGSVMLWTKPEMYTVWSQCMNYVRSLLSLSVVLVRDQYFVYAKRLGVKNLIFLPESFVVL